MKGTYFEKTLRSDLTARRRRGFVSVFAVHSAGRCNLFRCSDTGDLYSQQVGVGGTEGGSRGSRGARAFVFACNVKGKGRVNGHSASDGADDGDITNASAVTKSLFDFFDFFFISFFFCNMTFWAIDTQNTSKCLPSLASFALCA